MGLILIWRSTSVANPEDLDTVISTCEEIGSSVHELLARFRRRRNAALPVNSLPTEIMTVIIKEAVPRELKYYEKLRTIGLVSRRWADIIWDCQAFWTVVICNDLRTITTLALSRARNLPLDVMVLCKEARKASPREDHLHETFGELVGNDYSRWRSLTLDVFRLYNVSYKYLGELVKNLREITIKVEEEDEMWESSLYEGAATQLQALTLSGCGLRWSRAQLPHLRSLTLDRLRENQIRMDDAVKMIMSCPELEYLTVTGCTIPCGTRAERGEPASHEHSQISVPSLKSFHLSNNRNAHHLACRLVTPKCTNYHMDVNFDSQYEWKVSQYICPWINHICSGLSLGRLRLTLGSDHFTLQCADKTTAISVDISMDTSVIVERYKSILTAIDEPLRRRITHLTIMSASYEDSKRFPEFLALLNAFLPSVKTLSLQSYFVHNLTYLELLTKSHPELGWFLPNMERLELRVYRFDEGGEALLGLVRASNDQRGGTRPARLSHARLEQGWIMTGKLREIEALGVEVKLEEMEVGDVSPTSTSRCLALLTKRFQILPQVK